MHEMYMLMKRDLLSVKMHMKKRIAFVFLLFFALNCLYVITGEPALLLRGIIGSEAFLIKETLGAVPVHWILVQISGILVSYDFVSEDLYCYSSSIIVRLGYRRHFWQSKIIIGALICILLSFLYFCSNLFAGNFFAQALGQESLSIKICSLAILFNFSGMFSSYCIFHLASLLLNEVWGVIFTLVFLCAGLVSDSLWLPTNHVMPIRNKYIDALGVSSYGQNIVFLAVVVLCASIAGMAIISAVDVLERKGD